MRPSAWWVAATCIAVAAGAHYSDYSNAKMPEYGGGDYEALRDSGSHVPAPDYYREPAAESPHPHETHSSDYKYEEETGKSRKHNDLDDAEMWQNPTKNQKSANHNKQRSFDYNSDDIDLKLSNRHPKYRPRSKIRGSQEDEAHKHLARYEQYDKKESGDLHSEIDNEDSKIDLHDENTDYKKHRLNIRSTTARVIRRKPRDRYVKPPTEDEVAARSQKSDFTFNDERTSKPRTTPTLDRQSKKRVESDLLKSKPKVKQYGEYDDYYDMKRVLGIKQKLTEQDEGKHSKSDNNVPDLSPQTSSKANWWPKRHDGDKWTDTTNAEMVQKRTSMKQMEDIPDEELVMTFPDLYSKKQMVETSTKYSELPYSPYLRKFVASTPKRDFDLPYQRSYLRKQNIKDTSEEDSKLSPYYKRQMIDSAEQDFELPYPQPNVRKQMADTVNEDIEMSYPDTYSRKHANDTVREDFEQPYLDKQKVEIPKINLKQSPLRSNFRKQMAGTSRKDFERPYQESSFREQMADTANEDLGMSYPDTYSRKHANDTAREDFEQPYLEKQKVEIPVNNLKPSTQKSNLWEQIADTSRKDFEPPYPEPSFREQIADTEKKDFELPYAEPSFKEQMADVRQNGFLPPYPQPNLKEPMANNGKEDFEPPYPEPTLKEPRLETVRNDFVLAYPRPSHVDIAVTRTSMFGVPYPRPSFIEIRKQTIDSENGDILPQYGADIQQSSDDEGTETWKEKNKNKQLSGLKGEWTLLEETSSQPIELFSVNDGRRNFEDLANINNIADYGHYAYDTEPVISTKKAKTKIKPAKAISLAPKTILNTTTTIITTTTTAATTTATTTTAATTTAATTTAATTTTTSTTTLAPDRVVVEEVRRKADINDIEISLAEKSKLSIMKKAQRKEMSKDLGTSKPPVLMQVTNKLYTVVMVEPPTTAKPWQRVKEVSADTPDHLKQVKRLMRHKLIANAKDVHDLTENWDDMICDYVDMSLVKDFKRSAATVGVTNIFIIFLSIIINTYAD